MTPAEKMAQRLEAETLMCSGVMVRRIPAQDDLDAAEMMRRLAAALVEAYSWMPGPYKDDLRERHADAMRDVKERA